MRATPELGQVQPREKGDRDAVQEDSEDAIPARARTGKPKSKSKSKSKSATKPESPKSPKKRGLSDAARKLLDGQRSSSSFCVLLLMFYVLRSACYVLRLTC